MQIDKSYSLEDLNAADKAIKSMLHKCEKSRDTLSLKQSSGSPQLSLLDRSLKALYVAEVIIKEQISGGGLYYSADELTEAGRSMGLIIHQVVTARPRLTPGTAQYTLLERRIKALEIAANLIKQFLKR